jgi:hypothetical protein
MYKLRHIRYLWWSYSSIQWRLWRTRYAPADPDLDSPGSSVRSRISNIPTPRALRVMRTRTRVAALTRYVVCCAGLWRTRRPATHHASTYFHIYTMLYGPCVQVRHRDVRWRSARRPARHRRPRARSSTPHLSLRTPCKRSYLKLKLLFLGISPGLFVRF